MVARRLYQTAAEQLAELIDNGHFAPGTRLPGERELSQRLGVSRATIREAEIALQATGRLQIRTGAGVYVSDEPAEASKLVVPSHLEVLEARLVVEGEAAGLAAARIETDELARIEGIYALMDECGGEGIDEHVRQLHVAIADASKNVALSNAVTGLWLQQGAVPACVTEGGPEDDDCRLRHYRALVEAIHARDPAAARAAARRCLQRQINEAIEAEEQRSLAEMKERVAATRLRFDPSRANRYSKVA